MELQRNVPLQTFHSFALEANTAYLYNWDDNAKLPLLLDEIMRHERVQYLGAGSNTLFLKDFNGMIVRIATKGLSVKKGSLKRVTITVAAGENWNALVQFCVAKGWYGLENLSMIPGTVGAAPVQNIGAYGVEVKDLITRVFGVDTRTRKNFVLDPIDCRFGYRRSIFKEPDHRHWLVTAVEFQLSSLFLPHTEYDEVKETAESFARGQALTAQHIVAAVTRLRTEKLPDPKVLPNAGSFFLNPVVSAKQFDILRQKYPDIPGHVLPDKNVKLSGAWLIDRAGLKGTILGGVALYERQPLVMVNRNRAVAADVTALRDLVQQKVFRQFGVVLQPEPVLVE